MLLVPIEEKMWGSSPAKARTKMSDSEITQKYELRENRILIEINREKLPSFVEALKKPGYMNVRPFYQRRARWTPEMQSKLIESLLIEAIPSEREWLIYDQGRARKIIGGCRYRQCLEMGN